MRRNSQIAWEIWRIARLAHIIQKQAKEKPNAYANPGWKLRLFSAAEPNNASK